MLPMSSYQRAWIISRENNEIILDNNWPYGNTKEVIKKIVKPNGLKLKFSLPNAVHWW